MGEVYRAYDRTFERRVALKVVRVGASEIVGDRETAKRRLLNEARLVSALEHPHIVAIYDAGESAGLPYLVLELCEGGNLRHAMRQGASQADRLRWLTQIAEALAHAHEHGIIHRDVKPENVLLTAEGTAKVADFGIAKALSKSRSDDSTTLGIVGTPRYMAPEQLFGGSIDARIDQFAWGIVACELLSDVHPRAGDADEDAASAVTIAPRVPRHLHRVFARAMDTHPRKRYPHFRALLEDLRELPRRRTWPAILGAVAGVALVGAVLAGWLGRGARNEHADQATRSPVATDAPLPFDAAKTDAAIVARCAPPARHHLAAGLQLWRDASLWEAAARFDDATKADPECASASVYYLITANRAIPRRREHFRLAREQRTKLGARERLFLDVLEPTITDMPDDGEVLRRTDALRKRLPTDLDAQILHQYMLYRLDRFDEVLAQVDQTAALAEAPIPLNELLAALVHLRKRDPSAALDRFRRCLVSAPDSGECLLRRSHLFASQGRCAEAQNELRHLTSVMPHNARAQFDLANVLLVSTHDAMAARTAFEERVRLYPLDAFAFDPTAEAARLADEYRMATVSGDLAKALHFARTWNDETSHSNGGRYRYDALWELIELLRELGSVDQARALARRGLREHRSWAADPMQDVEIGLARSAYLTGAIDAREYRTLRDAWIPRRPRSPVETWLGGFAGLPEIGAEMAPPLAPGELVEDALTMVTSPRNVLGAAAELLRVGRVNDAIQHADAIAQSCLVYSPMAYLQARLASAKAHEAAHDVAGACTRYAALRDLLAKSPRSTSLRFAVERLHALSCREL
ncbi:protein kinase [Pendulispora albinea]|uniref:Protein kinase n=2 Tax=Pendulispora albinea TaxID=2741071 RepID=A0ABZ2M4E0_9BACT